MPDWTTFDRVLAARRRAIVESFLEFLRLESVSQEPDKVRVTGEWLAAALRARGLAGRVLETGGNPAVYGERRNHPGRPEARERPADGQRWRARRRFNHPRARSGPP